MRVLCAISTMGPGGAERVMAALTAWLARHHEVTLVSFDAVDHEPFYPLAPTVHHVRLDLLGGAGVRRVERAARRLVELRRLVRRYQPDVVVSFIDVLNVTVLIAAAGTGVPVVVSERVDPARHPIGTAKRIARRALYPRAAACVVQTAQAADYFHWLQSDKLAVLGNPVSSPKRAASPAVPDASGGYRIVGVGRLVPQKGFDLLVEAFEELAAEFPDWDVDVYGEGPERVRLQERVDRAGLGTRFRLRGIVEDVNAELVRSHVLAFPSRYEGFPNALAEGLAAGLPAIGFAGVSGVDELIDPGASGLLADPARPLPSLTDTLRRLMSDPERRAEMGVAGRRIVAQWAPAAVLERWECLIDAAANRDSATIEAMSESRMGIGRRRREA